MRMHRTLERAHPSVVEPFFGRIPHLLCWKCGGSMWLGQWCHCQWSLLHWVAPQLLYNRHDTIFYFAWVQFFHFAILNLLGIYHSSQSSTHWSQYQQWQQLSWLDSSFLMPFQKYWSWNQVSYHRLFFAFPRHLSQYRTHPGCSSQEQANWQWSLDPSQI